MTTLFTGARIHGSSATAFAVTDGVLSWIGADYPGTPGDVVDLDGALVAPAFVDAHVHATAAGLLRTGLDLTAATRVSDVLDAVRDRAEPGALLWGHGWDETAWPENRPPTREELDTVAGGVPVYLSRIDVHSALVSSALVDLAPSARTAAGWSDTGPLARDAHHHVRRAARASIAPGQRRAAQHAFLRHAASMGVACVHECGGPDISGREDFDDLLTLDTGVEIVGYWGERGVRVPGARGLAGDLFVDGAFGSRTAALHEPYTDAPDTSGARYLDAEQIAAHLVACTETGTQAGFHVIGDAAVAEVVDGFRRAEKIVGERALVTARHRLEHLEMVTAEQADELARFGVVASVQPLFDAAWGGQDGMYARRLGARAAALNPFATLAAAGVTLAFGSDTPVTPVDPWATIRAAVHHRTPGSGIDETAAFAAHTSGGRAAARDPWTGELTVGAPATFAVWRDQTCLRTVRNGQTIHEVPLT
ncbi:amidohydrolase [Actinophytocola gossypii]|uniref:Amidohydrolase family protein n=1 Tax=Actinophytocola gossypii TaxID=2812003 RepID=A0ABT2J1D4_9PSEU|nr:amidohydrolase family protein [Actinophytocola gossypii]MCT2581669.1 amidohydrolase family protein [Actinophytocola gossypii]